MYRRHETGGRSFTDSNDNRFRRIPSNIRAFNDELAKYSRQRDLRVVIDVFEELLSRGLSPSIVTYNNLLNGATHCGAILFAIHIYCVIFAGGFISSDRSSLTASGFRGGRGRGRARGGPRTAPLVPSIITNNTMLKALLEANLIPSAIALFGSFGASRSGRTLQLNPQLNSRVLNTVLRGGVRNGSIACLSSIVELLNACSSVTESVDGEHPLKDSTTRTLSARLLCCAVALRGPSRSTARQSAWLDMARSILLADAQIATSDSRSAKRRKCDTSESVPPKGNRRSSDRSTDTRQPFELEGAAAAWASVAAAAALVSPDSAAEVKAALTAAQDALRAAEEAARQHGSGDVFGEVQRRAVEGLLTRVRQFSCSLAERSQRSQRTTVVPIISLELPSPICARELLGLQTDSNTEGTKGDGPAVPNWILLLPRPVIDTLASQFATPFMAEAAQLLATSDGRKPQRGTNTRRKPPSNSQAIVGLLKELAAASVPRCGMLLDLNALRSTRNPQHEAAVCHLRRAILAHAETIGSDRPVELVVELCSGHGDWIVNRCEESAQATKSAIDGHSATRIRPQALWVAVEVRPDRVASIVTTARLQGVSNLVVIMGDATDALSVLHDAISMDMSSWPGATSSVSSYALVSAIFVNFPNPAPIHAPSAALVGTELVEASHKVLTAVPRGMATTGISGGDFLLATDNNVVVTAAAAVFGDMAALFRPCPLPDGISDAFPQGYGTSYFESYWDSRTEGAGRSVGHSGTGKWFGHWRARMQ